MDTVAPKKAALEILTFRREESCPKACRPIVRFWNHLSFPLWSSNLIVVPAYCTYSLYVEIWPSTSMRRNRPSFETLVHGGGSRCLRRSRRRSFLEHPVSSPHRATLSILSWFYNAPSTFSCLPFPVSLAPCLSVSCRLFLSRCFSSLSGWSCSCPPSRLPSPSLLAAVRFPPLPLHSLPCPTLPQALSCPYLLRILLRVLRSLLLASERTIDQAVAAKNVSGAEQQRGRAADAGLWLCCCSCTSAVEVEG